MAALFGTDTLDQPDLRHRLRAAVGRAGAGRAALRADLPAVQPAALDPPRHLPADAGRHRAGRLRLPASRLGLWPAVADLVRVRLARAGQPESLDRPDRRSALVRRRRGRCCCSARRCSATCGSPAPTRSRCTRRWSRGCRRSAGATDGVLVIRNPLENLDGTPPLPGMVGGRLGAVRLDGVRLVQGVVAVAPVRPGPPRAHRPAQHRRAARLLPGRVRDVHRRRGGHRRPRPHRGARRCRGLLAHSIVPIVRRLHRRALPVVLRRRSGSRRSPSSATRWAGLDAHRLGDPHRQVRDLRASRPRSR